MTTLGTDGPRAQEPLRLWPGVVLAVLQCVTWFVVPLIVPDQGVYGVLATLISGLGIVIWWVFFSRVCWSERVGMVVLMIVALFLTSRIVHVSVAKAGMGMLFFIYAIPLLTFIFALAVVAGARLTDRRRRALMVAAILLASGSWGLIRIVGISAWADFAWRWSPTPEDRLVALADDELAAYSSAPKTEETGADWPGFRGRHRDGIVPGVRIETDWSKSPPIEIWRRPIGPGWGSLAVGGDLVYTQEQRGDHEIVVCHNLGTGKPVWRHRDPTRFWEANAGPGPRATPTLCGGIVYALGATGILNALNAMNGAVVWSRNVADDADEKVPYWGFASSPLVVGDAVIVAAAGRLIAYDLATGNPRWLGPAHRGSYSSPHLLKLNEVAQILLLTGAGTTSVAPADGTVLWEHAWPGAGLLQPALAADDEIVVATSDMSGGVGLRRISVAHKPGGWTVEVRWTSRGLKPYFNDFVIHKGHAFGFDGSILACIDLQEGERKWKGGRYGNGQLLLLPDQELLVVLSEEGELALARAIPDRFTELARFPAITGKTWNHPVLVGDILLIRNGEEMAAFRLPLTDR